MIKKINKPLTSNANVWADLIACTPLQPVGIFTFTCYKVHVFDHPNLVGLSGKVFKLRLESLMMMKS